jgi:hypothetical protein
MKRFIFFQIIISLAIIFLMSVFSTRAEELDGKSENPRGPSQVYQVLHVYGSCPRVLSENSPFNSDAEPANPASPHWRMVLDQYGNVIRRDDLSATPESRWKNDATERAAKKQNYNEETQRVLWDNKDTSETKAPQENPENKQVRGSESSIQQPSQIQPINPPPPAERNPVSGKPYQVPKGGFVDPSTGDVYFPIATGYVNFRTGQFIRK